MPSVTWLQSVRRSRRCWPRPTSPRCASSAPARRRWPPACCRAGTTDTASRSSTSRLQRGHRAARHAQGHPRPRGARAVLPALRRPGLVYHHVPHHAGPDRRPAHRRGDHRGRRARRAPHQGTRRVPRVPARERGARPVRRGGFPEDGRHPRDRRGRAAVPALRRPVQGHGGAGRHEDLGGRTGGPHRRPPEGGRRGGGGLPGRRARRAGLRHRRAPGRPDSEPGRDHRVPAGDRHRDVQAARAAGTVGRTAAQPAGHDPQAEPARRTPRFLTEFRGRSGSAGTAAGRPGWGCGRRSRSA